MIDFSFLKDKQLETGPDLLCQQPVILQNPVGLEVLRQAGGACLTLSNSHSSGGKTREDGAPLEPLQKKYCCILINKHEKKCKNLLKMHFWPTSCPWSLSHK